MATLIRHLSAIPGVRAVGLATNLLEGVGDQTVIRINQHKSALREISFDLSPLNGAAAQLIGLLVPSLDLSLDFQGQFDSRGSHALGHERSNGLINGLCCDRLAVRLATTGVPAVADIPGLLPAPARHISDTEVPSTTTAYGASFHFDSREPLRLKKPGKKRADE
jgi:hypothetical protein